MLFILIKGSRSLENERKEKESNRTDTMNLMTHNGFVKRVVARKVIEDKKMEEKTKLGPSPSMAL